MRSLEIVGDQSIATIENELRSIKAVLPRALLLPVHPKGGHLGITAALIQLIITWARSVPDRVLLTHITNSIQARTQLDDFLKRPHGLIAVLVSSDTRSRKADVSYYSDAMALAASRLSKMNKPIHQAARGRRILFVTVDHLPIHPPVHLYHKKDIVVSGREFAHTFSEIMMHTSKPFPDPTVEERSAIANLTWELFKNTNDWARSDSNNVPIRPSVRGLICDQHNQPHEVLYRSAPAQTPLGRYIRGVTPSANGRLRFIEITVFDSGIGLAHRWLKRDTDEDIDVAEELEACRNCLRKHATTGQYGHEGLGLWHVVTALKRLRGFMGIRTGRLRLYRDFNEGGGLEETCTEDANLADWLTSGDRHSTYARAEGAVYTILVPIRS